VIILEAKAMVLNSLKPKQSTRRKDITVPLENARRALVTAMKFGKLLVIRLGTTAPDFVGLFNDRHLPEEGREERDTSGAGTAFFPLEVFYNGGSLFHDLVDCSNPSGTMPTVPVMSPEVTSRLSTCIATDGGGGAVKEDRRCTWAERLFREEDMRPHRNFALCRREFRVCVASQLPLEVVQEYLFGGRLRNNSTGSSSNQMTVDYEAHGLVNSIVVPNYGSCLAGESSSINSTGVHGVPPVIPAGYSGVLPPMEHFQLIYVNKDDDSSA